MPAASNAAIFSAAVPAEPEMIAPACPMRRPGGAVCPAMKPTTGFFMCFLTNVRGFLLVRAADLAHHRHGLRVRIGLERREAVDEVRAVDRVAADADARRLAEPGARELIHDFVGERA